MARRVFFGGWVRGICMKSFSFVDKLLLHLLQFYMVSVQSLL